MKKLLLTLIFSAFALCADFELNEYKTYILNDNGNGTATITDDPSIVVGSSGVVMRDFGNGLSSIIARAVVTKKDAGYATVQFEVYSSLAQKALPLPKFMPQSGDSIILNFLYNRALIIAPNAEVYNQIVSAFPNITFVHPDLVAADLNFEYKPNPSKDDFRRSCAKNAAGVIFAALDKEAFFIDCGSFAPLKTFKSGRIASYHLPFYTRVENIDTVFWKPDSGHINNYDKYYRRLILDEETGGVADAAALQAKEAKAESK